MKHICSLPLLALLLCGGGLFPSLMAQTNPKVAQTIRELREIQANGDTVSLLLETWSGDQYQGTFTRLDRDTLFFTTNYGAAGIPLSQLVRLDYFTETEKIDPAHRFQSLNASRYVFAPSAIPLKKGEAYYQNLMLIGNSVTAGLSDHVSLTGGVDIFSTIAAAAQGYFYPSLYVNLKAGYQVGERLYVGGGALAGVFPGDISAAIGYGLVTMGTTESNLSIGLGYGWLIEGVPPLPMLNLSGSHRVSAKLALVSENWLVPLVPTEYNVLDARYFNTAFVSAQGIRLLYPKVSIDLGMFLHGSFEKKESLFNEQIKERSVAMFPFPLPYVGLILSL